MHVRGVSAAGTPWPEVHGVDVRAVLLSRHPGAARPGRPVRGGAACVLERADCACRHCDRPEAGIRHVRRADVLLHFGVRDRVAAAGRDAGVRLPPIGAHLSGLLGGAGDRHAACRLDAVARLADGAVAAGHQIAERRHSLLDADLRGVLLCACHDRICVPDSRSRADGRRARMDRRDPGRARLHRGQSSLRARWLDLVVGLQPVLCGRPALRHRSSAAAAGLGAGLDGHRIRLLWCLSVRCGRDAQPARPGLRGISVMHRHGVDPRPVDPQSPAAGWRRILRDLSGSSGDHRRGHSRHDTGAMAAVVQHAGCFRRRERRKLCVRDGRAPPEPGAQRPAVVAVRRRWIKLRRSGTDCSGARRRRWSRDRGRR